MSDIKQQQQTHSLLVSFPLQSEEISLVVLPSNSISDIKKMIQDVTGVSPECLELLPSPASQLSDDSVISSHRKLAVSLNLSGGAHRSDLEDKGCNSCWYPFTFYCCCGWPCVACCGLDCYVNNCMKCGACECCRW